MDRLSAYAKWLVENEDKKGTPDFETVAKAYKELRLEDPFLSLGNQPPVEKQSVFRQVADVPIGIARGAAQGIRMIADAFGPDNVVSQAYRGMEDMLGELYSAQAKDDQKKIAKIMKDAEDKGIGDQLVAAVQAFATAPVDMLSQALGTAAPIVAGGLLGSVARLGATGIGAVQTGLGGAMGAGTVKGTIYEAVKSALTDSGEDPKVAEQKAREAQSYTGENWGQVLAGTVLGGIAGKFGAEDLLLKRFTQKAAQEGAEAMAPGLLRRSATAGATEAVPEMVQAGQEQLAENVALQRSGFDVPTFRGVAGQAALEGLAGAGLGAGLGALPGTTPRDQQTEEFRRTLEEEALKTQELFAGEKPEEKVEEKAKKLKLEDLDPTKVANTLKYIESYTLDPDKIKEKNEREVLLNRLKGLDLPREQFKAFEKIDSNEKLLDSITKFLTPKPEAKDKEGAALDQLDEANKQTGGTGADVSVGPGGETTTGGTAPSSTDGMGGAPDATQQTGVGAQQLDTALIEKLKVTLPTMTDEKLDDLAIKAYMGGMPKVGAFIMEEVKKRQGAISAATPPEAQQKEETRAEAPAQGTAVAEAPTATEPAAEPVQTGPKDLSDKRAAAKAALEARKKAAKNKGTLSIKASEEARLKEIEETLSEEELDFVNSVRDELRQNKPIDPEDFNFTSEILRPFDESRYAQQQDRIAALYEDAAARGSKSLKTRGLPKLFRDLTTEEIKAGEEKGGKLTADEREVFMDALGKDLTPAGATKALTKLSDYRDKKKFFTDDAGTRADIVANSIAAYEINRRIESKLRKLSLPSFVDLTEDEQQAYLGEAPLKGKVTGQQIIKGFDAIQNYNESLGTEEVTKEELDEGKAESAYDKAQREIQAEKLGMAGTNLPSEISNAAKKGDINSVINYLAASARGYQKNQPYVGTSLFQTVAGTLRQEQAYEKALKSGDQKKIEEAGKKLASNKYIRLSGAINRGIAELISDKLGGLGTKLRYIPTLSKDAATRAKAARILGSESKANTFIADYDPRTDTLTITDRALNETALMHELIHAVTVKMMFRYLTGNREGMTETQKKAAQDIIKIYNAAKRNPTIKDSFPAAFENVYEFISYGLSDPNMQTALRKMPSPIPTAKLPSTWSVLVDKIADLLGIKGLVKTLRTTPKEFIASRKTELYDSIQALRDTVEERVEPSVENVEALEELEDIANQEYQIPDLEIQQIKYGKSGRKRGEKRPSEKPQKISKQEYESRINRLVDAAIIAGRDDTSFLQTDVANVELNEQNALFDLMANFEQILSAPEAIPEFDKSLQITDAEAQKSIDETDKRLLPKLEASRPTIATKTRAVKSMFDKDGRTRIIELAQNYRYRLDRLNDYLRRAGKLISHTDKQNNAGTAVASSAGRAETIYQKEFYTDVDKANDMLADLSKASGLSVEKTLTRLHMYAIHLHDKERREIKYLREAPLTDDNAVKERIRILNEILNVDRKALGEAKAKETIGKLRDELKTLVDTNIDTSSVLADKNNDAYNTLGPYSIKDIEAFGMTFKGNSKKLADDLIAKLQKIEKTTIEVNKKANYFSPPVQNLVDFYNFDFYFPFKGRPDSGPTDYQIDYNSPSVGGELQDNQEAFDGRITDSDNPILNVLNEASRSAMRLGRSEAGVTLSIKNLIDSKIIKGKPVGKITFAERFNNKFTEGLRKGEKNIFHYLPDGTIEIYEIGDMEMLQAIKRPIRDDNWFIDSLGKATSMFGQMHTRYNPAFAPMDFLRNLFTYAGVLGAETSGKRGLQVMSEMAGILAKNGFTKTAKYSLAFSRGNAAEMARLAKSDPFYKDLNDYYELGGRVAYLQGITIKDNLTDAVNAADRNGVIKSLSGANKFFDAWLDMFEMSTRIAAYRTMRDQFVAEGMPLEQAKIEAVAYAKNLANFEKTGIRGKELGAFFMFFRPAATGAVRAYEALSPALDYFKSDEELKKIVKKETEDVGKLTDADINKLVKEYRNRTKSAAAVSTTLFGVGAATFMMAAAMAGDDDEGRNKVLTDDAARWVRNARFNTGIQSGGKDIVLQIPWGFGPGAFASVGAQIAAFASGSQSFGQFINNVLDAGAESFMPIPISKINKFEHPVEAALDSVLPSALKPLFEWAMNMDGLGREIYNNRQSRNNDAYTGGDNIPEMFKDAARLLYNMSDGKIDVSPNTMYFFSNNYLDGVSRLASWSYNTAHTIAGNRDFDFKTDTLLLDAYLKAPSNYDARQFSEVAKEIKSMEQRYRAFTTSGDPERMAEYFQEYPNDKAIIDYYSKYNAKIDKLREMANVIRRDQSKTIKERQDEVRILIDNQNKMKSAFVQSVAAYGIEPD